jgi:hypothetical protein
MDYRRRLAGLPTRAGALAFEEFDSRFTGFLQFFPQP